MSFAALKRRASQVLPGSQQVRQPPKPRQTYTLHGGFLLGEKDKAGSREDCYPMAPSDIAALNIPMKTALWFCDVVLNSGNIIEVYATFFKEPSQLYTVRWVFQEIRKVLVAYLTNGKYHDLFLKISKITNNISGMSSCGGATQMDGTTGLWDEICFPSAWFDSVDSLHLEDYLTTRVDGPTFAFEHGHKMPAITLIHETAHLVSCTHWRTMVELARGCGLRADLGPMEKGIVDANLSDFANDASSHDNHILDLADDMALATNHPTDQGGVLQAFGFMTPFLAALENGTIGSLLNAESYAMFAWYHGMLYLDAVIQPTADLAFVNAEAELFTLVEAYGLETQVLYTLDQTGNPRRSTYVYDELSPASKAVYEHKRQQVLQVLNTEPQPVNASQSVFYSPAGFQRCEDVPIALDRMFPPPIRPWWRDPGPDCTSAPWALHPERILTLGYTPSDLTQPDVDPLVRRYMTDCWEPATQGRFDAAVREGFSFNQATARALSSPSVWSWPAIAVPDNDIPVQELE